MATKTKAELEQIIANLQAQIEELKNNVKVAEAPAEEPKPVEAAPVATPVYTTPASTDVVVVYTSHSRGHLEGNQFSIDANVYGEEYTLSRSQFDELAGKYRRWFNKGILAVSWKNVDVAAAKGLPIDRDNGLSVKELHSLGSMSPDEIEKLWNKVKYDSLRMSIVTYYKEQFFNGVPGYQDRVRVDTLNRLTEGGFEPEVSVMGGKRYRVRPIDAIADTED